MPYTAQLFHQPETGLVEALIWTGSSSQRLTGHWQAPMHLAGVSGAGVKAHESALEEMAKQKAEEGYVNMGEYLVGIGLLPRKVQKGLSCVDAFTGLAITGQSVDLVALQQRVTQHQAHLAPIQITEGSVTIGTDTDQISLVASPDNILRGQIQNQITAEVGLTLLWVAKEAQLTIASIVDGALLNTENITISNPLLSNFGEGGWLKIEDLAGELGLVKKQIRMSSIGSEDCFF